MTRRNQSERYIQASFEAHARAAGWLTFHTYNSMRSEPGFPDAVCLRNGRCVVVELKTERGRTSPAQRRWIDEFDHVPGVTAFVAHCPRDWGRITEALR
jgi:hypothetical protein